MSNRERWIVYPLLLFAVGSAVVTNLRSQAIVSFGTVECNRLVVTSPQGLQRIVLGSSIESQGGQILVHGPSAGASNGTIISVNDVQAEIGADHNGGYVKIAGAEGVPFLALGHDDVKQFSGLVASDQNGALYDAAASNDSVWGTTIAWESVPNANREFEKAKSELRSSKSEANADNTDNDDEPQGDATN